MYTVNCIYCILRRHFTVLCLLYSVYCIYFMMYCIYCILCLLYTEETLHCILGMGTIDFMKSKQLSRQFGPKNWQSQWLRHLFFLNKFLNSIIRSTTWPNKWPRQLSSKLYDQNKSHVSWQVN